MITVLTLLSAAQAQGVPYQWRAGDPPEVNPHGVVLWEHPNFTGDWWLANDESNFPNSTVAPNDVGTIVELLTPVGWINLIRGEYLLYNDTASSAATVGGAIANIYEHYDNKGAYQFIRDSSAHMPLDDKASSVKFLGNEDHPYIVLYEHTYYNGDFRVLLTNDLDLRYYGAAAGFDDTMTSIKLVNGAKARICKDWGGYGHCVDVNESIPDLRTVGMDDTVTSVLATHPHALLWEHPNYTGNVVLVTEDTDLRGARGLSPINDINDRATSMAVFGGASVTINKNSAGGNTGTDSVVVTDHVPDLRTIGMDDTITYVEID